MYVAESTQSVSKTIIGANRYESELHVDQHESQLRYTICFTICVCNGPDMDGHTAPKTGCDHVILGPQPVIDVGSGHCFWRASTHPDPEMAKTGKRQREGAGGGGGGSSKKAGRGSEKTLGGGGTGAGLELPGLNVSLPQHMRDVDCRVGDIRREKQKANHVPLVRKIR